MKQTYKWRHNRDFSDELEKSCLVAMYALEHKGDIKLLTTRYVSHIGLPSAIANQILRKYGYNEKIKKINKNKCKLIIPNQALQLEFEQGRIYIPCLNLYIPFKFEYLRFYIELLDKINQIEIDNEFVYITMEICELPELEVLNYIGVDLNATGHAAVAACPITGKILKLGQEICHIKQVYRDLRTKYQRQGRYLDLKLIKEKEKNKVKDLLHKIANIIIRFAKQNNCGIKMEDLTGIRNGVKKTSRNSKKFRRTVNNWNFSQLRKIIEYKARLHGIEVILINPRYTSQVCSKCKLLGIRSGKKFKCPHCGHADHADVNAAFNIATITEEMIACLSKETQAKGVLIPRVGNTLYFSGKPEKYKAA